MAGFGLGPLNAILAGVGMGIDNIQQQRQREQDAALRQVEAQNRLLMLQNYLQDRQDTNQAASGAWKTALGGGLPTGAGAGGGTSLAPAIGIDPSTGMPGSKFVTPKAPMPDFGASGEYGVGQSPRVGPPISLTGGLGIPGAPEILSGQPAPPVGQMANWDATGGGLNLPPPRTNQQDAGVMATARFANDTPDKIAARQRAAANIAGSPENTPPDWITQLSNTPAPTTPQQGQAADGASLLGATSKIGGGTVPTPGTGYVKTAQAGPQTMTDAGGDDVAARLGPRPKPLTEREVAQAIEAAAPPGATDAAKWKTFQAEWPRLYQQRQGEIAEWDKLQSEGRAEKRDRRQEAISGQEKPEYGSFVGPDGKTKQGEVYWDKQRKSYFDTDTGQPVKQFKPMGKPEVETPEIEVPEKWSGMPSKPPPGISPKVWTWALAAVKSGGEIKPPLPWGKSAMRDQFNQAIPAAQYALGIDPQDMDKQRIEYVGRQANERSIMNAFGGGMLGRNMISLNTVADHVALLRQYALALQNHDLQMQNQVVNRMATQAGWPEVVQFALAGTIAGDEVVRLLTTTGGTREDREGIQRLLSPYNSPEQLVGAVDTLANFVRSRYDPLKQQYSQGNPVKEQHFINEMLTPEARDLYTSGPPATVRGGPAPSSGGPNAAPQGAAPQGGDGEVIQNGWRYNAKTHEPIGPVQ